MKTCFVIMPYGGDNSEKRTHYLGVFQSIIMPAASRAGYIAKRSDLAGAPGNITRDIIENLLDSDIVIADLTEANANVFFELGIRHAFRKSGTIHLVDETYPLVFDINQYRAIKYSQTLASLPKVIDQIVEAIRRREEQVGRADNPVHDAVTNLPVDIRTIGDAALREQMAEIQDALQTAAEERDKLISKIKEINPGSLIKDEDVPNVDAILDAADEQMRTTGPFVLLSLTNAAEKGIEYFVKELRATLKSENLAVFDFTEIASMCARFGLDSHRTATLEVGRSRYPLSRELLTPLAYSYFNSPNARLKESGRIILEKQIGVEYVNNEPIVKSKKGDAEYFTDGIRRIGGSLPKYRPSRVGTVSHKIG